jgi:iron complex outermembrane receptor protein
VTPVELLGVYCYSLLLIEKSYRYGGTGHLFFKTKLMKSFFGVLLSVIVHVAGYGQSEIRGVLVDKKIHSVGLASVALLSGRDSSVVKGTLTTDAGEFRFGNLKSGTYLLHCTVVGYQKFYSPVISIDSLNTSILLDTIKLKEEDKQLQGITIISQKPFMEKKLDRLVFNLEGSFLSVGNTSLEALERLPGVMVDPNGNISVNGKGGFSVYINDRPTHLTGNDLASFLNSLNASQIEKVEILANPSSKYDAAGSGIINIRLKKDQRIGMNGNVNASYGQGQYPRFLEGLNLNYRTRQVNLYGGVNQNNISGYTDISSIRYFNNDSLSFDQNGKQRTGSASSNFRMGMDWNVSKKILVGVLLNKIYSKFDNRASYTTLMKNYAGASDSSLQSANQNNSRWRNFSGNLNMKWALDSQGTQLNADLDYVDYSRSSHQVYNNLYLANSGAQLKLPDTLQNDFPGSLHIYSLKTDFSRRVYKMLQLDVGIKVSAVTNENNLQFYNERNAHLILNDSLSNHFVYKEIIKAAYMSLSREWKKVNVQTGLRFEQTTAHGDQLSTATSFKRSYQNLFPSLFITYTPKNDNQFGFSYTRRINRPSYAVLNPYKRFYDPFNYEEGNPYLNPELSHSINFSYTYKSKLNIELGGNYLSGAINNVVRQSDTNRVTVITYDNLARAIDGLLGASYFNQVLSWWNTSVFAGLFFNYYRGPYLNGELNTFKPTFNFNAVNTFTLSKTIKAEVSANYLSGQQQGLLDIKPIGLQINSGIQKSFFKNQGSLKLNIRDIFKSRKWNYTTQFENIHAYYYSHNDSRIFTVALSWRFGKKTVAAERKRSTGTEEEKERVKQSDN